MRNQWTVVTTLSVVIFLTACSRSTVNLEYTNARGEVKQLGNLSFRFDKALVTDSLLNQWDSGNYVSFEPAIAGRFLWFGNSCYRQTNSSFNRPSGRSKKRERKEINNSIEYSSKKTF